MFCLSETKIFVRLNQRLMRARAFEMPIFYRDQQIGTRRVDFFVEEVISVELKAITKLELP